MQERVATLEKELAKTNKEIEQRVGLQACDVVKALLVQNADLDMDYSFLPFEYLESIKEWGNEEDIDPLEPKEKEWIIKQFGSLKEYYEHFEASSHSDSENEDDAPQEPKKGKDHQSSWTGDNLEDVPLGED